MSITATPTLSVGGSPLAGSLAGGPQLLAVDDLVVHWGRSSVLEAPTPATAQLTVLDRTPGASMARSTDYIGGRIDVGWAGSDGSSGRVFSGRITDVAATPRPGARPGGGFLVKLAASSLEVDLANYTVPEATVWPAETLEARRARIAALIPSTVAASLTMPDRYSLGLEYATTPDTDLGTLPAAAQDVSGRSVLELARGLAASWSPLPLVYSPAGSGSLTYATRRRFAYLAGPGFIASALAVADPDRGGRLVPAGLGGLHLDGGLTAYSGSLTQQLDSRVTRVEVTWLDGTNTSQTVAAATSNTGNEALYGRRVLTVQSQLGSAAAAQQLANLYADIASVEARAPRLGALGWSSTREPLHSAAHAALLLSGWETSTAVFIADTWLPQLGISPLVGLLGGSISYADGAWAVDATPAPTSIARGGFSWAPITPAACAATVRARDVDSSLTFGDVGWLDVGLGHTLTDSLPYRGNPSP